MDTLKVNEETTPKEKAYIVCTNTLKELIDMTKASTDRYVRNILYEKVIDLGDISENQRRLQMENRWYADSSSNLQYSESDTYKIIKRLAIAKVLNGYEGELDKSLTDAILALEIRTVVLPKEQDGGGYYSPQVIFELRDTCDDEGRYAYSRDIKEFEDILTKVRYHSSYGMKEDEYVYLENFSVGVHNYSFNNLDEKIKRLIKKVIRTELTYCLKNGKVIVPQEYLDRQEAGIKEWRETKASGNKNNSMEKRMLRQIVAQKKAFAFEAMTQIMHAVVSVNQSWSIPSLEVEGRWNKQKTTKLINQILNNKSAQFYIDTPEDEIVEQFKKYWKDTLMETYNNVDATIIKKGQ